LGTVVVSSEYSNESSYSRKDEKFFDQLGDYQVLKDLGPRSWEPAGGQISAPSQELQKGMKIRRKNKMYRILIQKYVFLREFVTLPTFQYNDSKLYDEPYKWSYAV
jgi:hypothetical protein